MRGTAHLAIKTRSESTIVDTRDIIYIERIKRKILLVTTERLISFYDDLKHITPVLGDNFFEARNGLIVNLDKMKSATDGIVYFEGGYELSLSQRSFVKVKAKHFAYHRLKQLNYAKAVSEEKGEYE